MDSRKKDDNQIAKIAGNVSNAVKIGEITAKTADVIFPRPIKAMGELSAIVKEAAQDRSSSSAGEKFICAAASETVKVLIAAPFVTAAAAAGSAGGPPGAAIAGGIVGSIVTKAAKPVGDDIQKMCHAGFDWLKGEEKAGICAASPITYTREAKQPVQALVATSHPTKKTAKTDLPKQTRQSAPTTSSTDQSIDKLFIDLLTNVDITGFEHNDKVKSLKAKLDACKQSPRSTPFDMLQAAQKLHVEKAKVAEEEKRKEEYINNAHHCVDIASKTAYLLGNNKRAQQISTIGDALINVSLVVASIETMNPLAAASTLLGACASIKSLFTRHKAQDSNKIILDALQVLGEQLQTMQREMHERFDQIMEALDEMNRNMIKGFLKLDWKSDHIIEQIQALHSELHHLAEQQANIGETILEHLTGLEKNIERNSLMDEATKIFTLTGRAKRNTNPSRYDKYATDIETHALEANVGAKHPHIVGGLATTKGNDVPAALKVVTDNHLHHRSGYYFAFNTLLSYFENLGLKSDYYYQPSHVKEIIDLIENPEVSCSPVLGLSHFLIDEPDLPSDTRVVSLRKTLESMDTPIQFIPIQSHGSWHLLVADTRQKTFHYYGRADQLTLNRLFASLDTMKGYEQWRHKTHATCIAVGLGQEASALLVIKQCWDIANQQKVTLTLNKRLAANLHDVMEKNHSPRSYNTPAHPLIWQSLSDTLNALVNKQYPDAKRESLTTDEIARFQGFIYEGDYILSQLQRLRNPEFIRLLIKNYEASAKALSEKVQEERATFEKNLSEKITSESELVLREALFETDALKTQKIDVSADYALHAGGMWFYTSALEFNLKKNRGTGVNSGDGLNHPTGDDIRVEYKGYYIKARMDDINSKKDAFVKKVDNDQKKETYTYNTDLEGNWNCSTHLPVVITPLSSGDPILPMPEKCYSIIQDTYYRAQMIGLGQIKCAYKILNGQFILSAHFVQDSTSKPNKKNKISSITIPYKPSFFKGPEAIWWWWMGGNYCHNLHSVSKIDIPPARYAGGYCGHVQMRKSIYFPVCTEGQGVYHDIDDHLENVQFHNEALRQQTEANISDSYDGWRGEWSAEVKDTISSDEESPLGQAAAAFEACATLLSLVSEMVLTDKNQPDVFTQFINEHPECAFDLKGLRALLTSSNDYNIATKIAPNDETSELLTTMLCFLEKNRWNRDFPLFERSRVIVSLLQCMDSYVPNMRKGLTVSQKDAAHEKLCEMNSYALGAACQGFRSLHITDPEESRKRDGYVAQLEQYREVHDEVMGRIARGVMDTTPMITVPAGYHQHNFLRHQESEQKVEKKPVVKKSVTR